MRFLSALILFLSVLMLSVCKATPDDSLRVLVDAISDANEKAALANRLSHHYLNRDLSRAIEANELASGIAAEGTLGDSLELEILFTSALAQARMQRNDSAILLLSRIYTAAIKINEPLIAARTVNERAICYESMGDYRNALSDYYLALKIYDDLRDQRGIMNQYLNIGLIYQYQKNYTRAAEFTTRAIDLATAIGNETGVISGYNNLGIIYQEQQNYDEALNSFRKVLEFDLRTGDSINIAGSLNNMGVVYHGLGRYKQALDYFSRSLELKTQLNDLDGMANTMNNIAECYTSMNDAAAEEWLARARGIATEYGLKTILLENYLIAKNFCSRQERFREALHYADLYQALKDSLALDEVNVQLEQLNKKHDLENAEKEITLRDAELQKRSYIQLFYLVLILVAVLAAIYLYLNMKRTSRLNAELKRQQQHIVEQHRELMDKNEEAEKARQQAETAAQVKSQFLSVMSHEIRTPLNAIVGLANLLNENDPKPEQRDNISVLKSSSDNLLSLVNDILDYSKLEAGKAQVNEVEFDLEKLVGEVFSLYRIKARERKLDYRLVFDPALPHRLIGDPMHLNQVLLNLISNAVKFTHEGFVQVEVKLLGADTESCRVSFSVSDSGIGIPVHKLNSIFEAFTQVDSHTTRNYGGTGLGLSICKKILQVLGADLQVQSTMGKGSLFSFTLALKRSEDRYKKEVTVKTPDMKDVNVLIVEDNSVNVFVINQFLKKWGARSEVAENGLQAVEKCRARDFDVILMDLHMPVMDGFEASREILIIKPASRIIAITAAQETDLSETIQASGMIGYVTKPFQPDELAGKIRSVLA